MNDPSWSAIVRLVHERAGFRCEYCQTSQRVTGQAMHVEHIDPRGGDHLDNLCLSCPNCNLSKAAAVEAIDPQTGHIEALFHPRRQQWADHFEWDVSGTRVIGKTPVGRATVVRFRMNSDRIIIARRIWVRAREHPPTGS